MNGVNTNDEFECPIDLSLRRPDAPKPVIISLTPFGPTKTSAKKNVPAAETSINGDKEKNVDADTPRTKPVLILPKKRPYVVPQIQTEEKQITHIMAIVTKQTEEVKEVIAGSQTEPLRNQSEVTHKKSQAPELAASDKTTAKPARETGKKQCQKASTSQPSTSQPSTSQASTSKASTSQPSTSQPSTSQASTPRASTSKVSTSKASTSKVSTSKALTSKASTSKASTSKASTSKASTSKASTSKASTSKASTSKALTSKASTSKASTSKASTSKASTSKASTSKASTLEASTSKTTSEASTSVASSSSRSKINDSQFWGETVESKFQSGDYKNLLIESNFSEQQATSLQSFFHRVSRQLYNTLIDGDRVTKMHKCRDCPFSIRHRCVSYNFLHVGRANDDLAETSIPSQKTIICICKFAFFHVHNTRPSSSKTVETSGLNLIPHPLRENHVARLRCAECDATIIIEHPLDENTDCTFKTWSAINSSNEKTFHAQLSDHIKNFTTKTPSLQELYTCNSHCCLLFHRCTE